MQRTKQDYPLMREKSIKEPAGAANSAEKFLQAGKRRLELKQIRGLVEQLLALPDGAPMPDWSNLSIGDRLAVARRLVSTGIIEEVTGKSDSQLQRYEIAPTIPLTSVAALAAETQIPVQWFVTGNAMDRKAPLVRITPDAPQADPDDVPVQKLAFKAAAGRGALILDELADHIRFPRAILDHVGVAPQNARLMEASGESMRDTISDGDLLLVDVSQNAQQVVEGKIYVFAISNEAYVKRLRRAGERMIMISDNKELFPAEDVPEQSSLQIFGRVRWTGRSL